MSSDPAPVTQASVDAAKAKARIQRAQLPEFCPDCGLANRLHRGVTGTWLGCDIAAYVRRAHDRPENPERWNDPYTVITLAVRAAMVDGSCGPLFEGDMAHYSNDEQLAIASALVKVAVGEYVALIARGER